MATNPEIDRFGNDIAGSQELRDELKKFGADNAAIVQFANAKGYKFTLADADGLAAGGEMTDTQLESVAGGAMCVSSSGFISRWLESPLMSFSSPATRFFSPVKR